MKVLFQSRLDLYSPRGGDTTQIEYTKKFIESLYADIKIDINNDLQVENIKEYDIVHLFNIDWVCETYLQAEWAKAHNRKLVISAIHHSEKEVLRYEQDYRFDFRKVYNAIFRTQSSRDIGKNIYRALFNYKKIYPAFVQLIHGIRNEQREALSSADLIFVQTNQEAVDINRDFGLNLDKSKFVKVVNGVNKAIFSSGVTSKLFTDKISEAYGIDLSNKQIILNVGRIESRKNQLSLINAFNNLKDTELKDIYLVFIGDLTKRSPEYVSKFNKAIGKDNRILHFAAQPQGFIASAMSHNGIYVQPSWFETTGLVALEAAASGMPVVASGLRIKEYLEDAMVMCDPGSVATIQNGILEAFKMMNKQGISVLAQKIGKEYSWDKTAEQTVKAYKSLK